MQTNSLRYKRMQSGLQAAGGRDNFSSHFQHTTERSSVVTYACNSTTEPGQEPAANHPEPAVTLWAVINRLSRSHRGASDGGWRNHLCNRPFRLDPRHAAVCWPDRRRISDLADTAEVDGTDRSQGCPGALVRWRRRGGAHRCGGNSGGEASTKADSARAYFPG